MSDFTRRLQTKRKENLTQICQGMSTDVPAPGESEIAVKVDSTHTFHFITRLNLLGNKSSYNIPDL